MARMRGFRCGRCGAEILAASQPSSHAERRDWSPPILCCGQPLRSVEPDQVLPVQTSHRRILRCPRCDFQVQLIVHPADSLVCMLCQTEFVATQVNRDRVAAQQD